MTSSAEKTRDAISIMTRTANLSESFTEMIVHKSNPEDSFRFDRRDAHGDDPIYYMDFNVNKTLTNAPITVNRSLTNLSIIRNTNLASITTEAFFGDSAVTTNGDTSFFKSAYTSTSVDPNVVTSVNTVRHLTTIKDVDPKYTPAYIIIPSTWSSIQNLVVTSNNPLYIVTGYKSVIYVDSRYVNRLAVIISIRINNTGNTTVKTYDGKELSIKCDNTWFNGSLHTFTLNLSGKAVIISGTENITTVSSRDIVFIEDLNELKVSLIALRFDVTQLQKMVDSINSTVNQIISEDGADLLSVIKDIKDGGVSNSSVVRVFSLLCEFADKIGVPYVKTFSNVVNAIYRLMTDSTVDRNGRFSTSGPSPAVYQSLNSIPLEIVLTNSQLGVTKLNDDLLKVFDLINTSEKKYTTVSIIGTDAFGFSDIMEALSTNYGDGVFKMKEMIDRYPLHIYLIIKEHDPTASDDPNSRILRIDAGMDLTRKLNEGEFSMLPYNFDFAVYTLGNIPKDVANRDLSRVIFPLGSDICAFSFDKIVELAKIFQLYAPKYDALTYNCQDISMGFHHTITKGEIGYISHLLE